MKATGQTCDTRLKIPPHLLLFPTPHYTYQPHSPACPPPVLRQTSVSEKIELPHADEDSLRDVLQAATPQDLELELFLNLENEIRG